MTIFDSTLPATISLEEIEETILAFSTLPSYLRDPFEEVFAEYIDANPGDAETIWDYIVQANSDGASLDLFDDLIATLVNTPSVSIITKNEIISLLQTSEASEETIAAVNNAYNSQNSSDLSSALANVNQAIFLYESYESAISQVIPRAFTDGILGNLNSAKETLEDTIENLSA